MLDLYLNQPESEQLSLILDQQPHVVAFPLYLWNRKKVLQLCRQLRHRQPEILLYAGGPEASVDSQRVIAEGQLNGVFCGEGEEAFVHLMLSLADGTPREVPGFLPAETPDDQYPTTASCPDLTRLPSPWLQGDLPLSPGCGVLWEVARGCIFNCAFCYDAKGQQGVRTFSEERLRAELQLFARNRVGQIWVLDSTFNAPAGRGRRLLQLLREEAPRIHVHLEAKADFLDQETIALLGRLSCSVQIGLQSANNEVLKSLHRSIKPAQMQRTLQKLNAAGVTFGLDLIYGLPGDNHAGFCRSLDFALNQQPNQVDIFPLAVLRGTELHNHQQEFGLKADAEPPYLVTENSSYPHDQIEKSRKLASATDIFYNRGRAVGFFYQLCEALRCSPSRLLEDFGHWFCQHPGCDLEAMLDTERWQPAEILPLQLEFAKEKLRSAGLKKLVGLCEDLIRYHYLCAESLLAEECRAQKDLPPQKQWRETCWRLNPAVRVQRFQYALEELDRYGGEHWSRMVELLRTEPGYGIFLCQDGQPIIESLEANFARLLLGSTGKKTAAQLLQDLPRNEANELLRFAVQQGLLLK